MPDKVKRKTQVATNKNRQREPEFNTYLDFPLNIIEGLVNNRSYQYPSSRSSLPTEPYFLEQLYENGKIES